MRLWSGRAVLLATLFALATLHPAAQAPTAPPKPVVSLAAAPDQVLAEDDVSLRYREVGRGPAVVLIHGYSRSLVDWATLADALGTAHRVVVFDVRGFGKSSKFADASRFGLHLSDDVVRLLDHLRIGRAHLVGHSMGALIAAQVAASYPARVLTTTLIAGPFYDDQPAFTRATAPWVSDLESGKGLTRFLAWLFPAMDAATASTLSAETLAQNDLPSLIAVMRSLGELVVPSGKATRVPALLAVGTADPLLPQSRAFAQRWPGARLLEVPGADHVNVAARPEFLDALRSALQPPVPSPKLAAPVP
jgi:pimeloyl-ACP methyl ester carboxylesterase